MSQNAEAEPFADVEKNRCYYFQLFQHLSFAWPVNCRDRWPEASISSGWKEQKVSRKRSSCKQRLQTDEFIMGP